MTFIAWALPVLGATLIITCSTLLRPLRDALRRSQFLHELIIYPMCTGFWVGLIASLLGHSFVPMPNLLSTAFPRLWIRFTEGFLQLFGDACAAAWLCWVSHVVLCHLGQGRLLSSRPDLQENQQKDPPPNVSRVGDKLGNGINVSEDWFRLSNPRESNEATMHEEVRNTTIPAPTRALSVHCDNCGQLFTEDCPRANTLGGWDICVPCVKKQGIAVRSTRV